MAVTNSDISSITRRLSDIERDMDTIRQRIEIASDNIAAEQAQRLSELRRDTDAQIERRDREVRDIYDRLLDANLSEQESRLQEALRKLQEQYDRVYAELISRRTELMHEKEELLKRQEQFEEMYYERLKNEKEIAEQTYSKAKTIFGRFANDPRSDWFLKGHTELYRARLETVKSFIENDWYQAAVATAEAMSLNIRLDELTVREEYRKWIFSYTVLCDMESTARRMLFTDCSRIDSNLFPNTVKLLKIRDGKISEEQADLWTAKQRRRLIEKIVTAFEIIAPFKDESGEYIPVKNIGEALCSLDPEKYTSGRLYRAAGDVKDLMKDISMCMGGLRTRLEAFEERWSLARALMVNLQNEGYHITHWGEKQGIDDPVHITFADDMEINIFEVIITPVMRKADNKCVTLVEWYCPPYIDRERRDTLTSVMAETFTEKGVSVTMNELREDERPEQRESSSVFNKKLMVNGRAD